MKLSTRILPLATLSTMVLSTNGKCVICPNGPDPSADGIAACSNLDKMYENMTAVEECAGVQMSHMPTCCPSQLPTMAKDNQCGWCPNGVSDIYAEVPLPFSTESVTCAALMFGILGTPVDAEVCAFYESVEPVCCPNDGAVQAEKCQFCPNGMDYPNTVLPSGDGTSCQDIQRYADLVFEGEMCENSFKPVEPMCCPSTTETHICDYCSQGLEFPDDMLDGSIQCSELFLFSKFANETECSSIKVSEALCCPSSAKVSLPPVSEGDYCYICGSADVEMHRPGYKPFALGHDNDEETCAEIEQHLNDERQPGSSCRNAVGSFTLFFSPSICGCDGYMPENHCEICKGGTVNRDAMAPGQNFTCGEGIDFLKHTSAAFCDAAEEVDLEKIDKACCLYDTNSNDGSEDQAPRGDAASQFHHGTAFWIVLSAVWLAL